MNSLLEAYIDPAFQYSFIRNPDVVRSREDAIRYGINCVSLAHLALQDLFEYRLPSELMCAEMFLDNEYFDRVNDLRAMRTGDLVWFGIENPSIAVEEFSPQYIDGQLVNWADFPVKHVAIYTGETGGDNDYLLLHSTHIEGTNVVWPLSKFTDYRKYKKLYGITRLKNRPRKIMSFQ